MKLTVGKYKKYLSQSILMEERGAPEILRIILLFIISLILLFIFWASRVELRETIPVQGELVPGHRVTSLEIPYSGVIEKIYIENNQVVKLGDPLLQLNNESLSITLEEEKIRGKVLQIEWNSLREELTTLELLLKDNLISQQEYQAVLGDWIEVDGALSVSRQKQKRLELQLIDYLLVAPSEGTIHGLKELHPGSVLSGGEFICQILPDRGGMVAALSLEPRHRGRLEVGQQVELQFPSYEYGHFGGITGELVEISGSTYMGNEGKPFYKIEVPLEVNALEKEGILYPLVLGMPVNGDVMIGTKTLLQYILFPVKTSLKRSFREE